MSENTSEVQVDLRIDNNVLAFYDRVAKLSGHDRNTVFSVLLAFEAAQHGAGREEPAA